MAWVPHITVASIIKQDDKYLFVEEYVQNNLVINQPAGHLEENESIIFSSSLKAIKLFKYQELSINKDDIIDFLSFGTVHSPNTFIDEIKSIPRASFLMASNEETLI